MTLDKETREAIAQAVRKAQMEAAEIYSEKWVTGAELCAIVGMITKDWLENFGWKLPRERVEIIDDDGKTRVTRWAYPRNQIQRMIRTRKFSL
jgi:hypothetical protein